MMRTTAPSRPATETVQADKKTIALSCSIDAHIYRPSV